MYAFNIILNRDLVHLKSADKIESVVVEIVLNKQDYH